MADSCALNPTAMLACEPSPEKVSAFWPVLSCRCRSASSLSRVVTFRMSGETEPAIPETAMTSSQLLQQVQHLLDRCHHARVGAVLVLQGEQIRQFLIHVDA